METTAVPGQVSSDFSALTFDISMFSNECAHVLLSACGEQLGIPKQVTLAYIRAKCLHSEGFLKLGNKSIDTWCSEEVQSPFRKAWALTQPSQRVL